MGSGKIVVIPAKFRGNHGRKGNGPLSEPRGASFCRLHVTCGSRRRLQQGLHMWSWFPNHRLAGLWLEQLAEPLMKSLPNMAVLAQRLSVQTKVVLQV